MKNFQPQIYFHFLVIPLSFVLYLYNTNVNNVAFTNIFRTLVVIVILVIRLYILLATTSRSWEKAAIVTSIFFVLILNFRSITIQSIALFECIHPDVESPANIPHYSAFILGIILIVILFIILRTKKELRTLNRLAGIFSIGMIGIVFGIMVYPAIGRLTNADQQIGKSLASI